MANIHYLKLEDISAYKIASELSDYVWEIVIKWEWFAKKTLGSQWTDAIDSIAANIAEGFGRFHKKDKQKFYYNARGSVYESAHWTKKALKRDLISQEEFNQIMDQLRQLPREINSLIKYTENKLTI
ncbi:four helix bundle protein [Candidatus Gottesmanbacteria bacterium]|nr:four helix bundle protein [Candidatus Gottesmanbacteria bacterium]